MGSERVGANSRDDEGSGVEKDNSAPLSYPEIFEKMCPEYMALGMTYNEYWNGDPDLPRYYRKANKIRNKMKNHEFWLQGMYIYEAMCDIAPFIKTFSKENIKPYPTEPYALDKADMERAEEEKAKREMEKQQAEMEAWIRKHNAGR